MQRRTFSRFDEILRIFRKYGMDKVLGQTTRNKISPLRSDADNKELLREDFPERLRLMFQELGTTFIKFGQLLSSRPDLVGERISEELSQLHDDNPPRDYEEIKETIETQLGGNIEDFFAEFSPILKDFEDALQNNDTVMLGDLSEYEICPRLKDISKALKAM